jgi:hypothetical protein
MKRLSRVGRVFAVAVLFAGSAFPSDSRPRLEPIGPAAAGAGESTPQRRPHLPPEPVSIALLGTVLLCGAVIARRRMA